MPANGIPSGGVNFPKSSNSLVRRYSPFLIGIIATVGVAVLVSCKQPIPLSVCRGNDCLGIFANKVTADADKNWTGSFLVMKSPFGIHSYGVAGACLFVESAALKLPQTNAIPPGGTCSNDDECTLADPVDPKFAGWEGRCEWTTGTCWIRPGGGAKQSSVCNKGLTPKLGFPTTPSNIPAFNSGTLNGYLKDGANRSIRVRVLARLIGSDGSFNEKWSDPVSLNTRPTLPTPDVHR